MVWSGHRASLTSVISSFSKKVYEITSNIPRGKVLTYGQIAVLAGNPKAVRAVGNALHKNPTPIKVPCHRVVNRDGKLAKNFGSGGQKGQKLLLEKEGVVVHGFAVNLKKYLHSL